MKKNDEHIFRKYGEKADEHWQEVMTLSQKYGFVIKTAAGTAILMTHKNQRENFNEDEYLRIQQMNGHCPKTFGCQGCLNEDGSLKECGSCWAVKDAANAGTKE